MTDFGEILRTIDDFGLFQKLILLALTIPNLFFPLHLASLIFIDADPSHHCNTDWILTAGPDLSTEEQLNLTVPLEQDGTFSKCLMFVPVDWDINTIKKYGLNDTTECQSGWVYKNTMYKATIVTDFDLVCGQANMVGRAQTVFMAGILLGSLLFGPFAESFGRKRATQIPMVFMFIFTVATGLCPNFYLYLSSQFIVGIAYGGFRINCIVLATEWIGVTRRSLASCVSQVFGGIGQCLVAVLIYYIRNWRLAQFVMASPIAVGVVYIWFVPESARWLLSRGETEEAKKLILRGASVNKRHVPDSLLEKITAETNVQKPKGGICVLIKSPLLRKYFLTITLGWFSVNLSYYCLTLNVGNFGLDIFLTQLMFGLTEIPAHILCIWLLEVLGRKISLMSTLLIGGFVCVLILVVPKDNAVAITALATTGRFIMNWAASICNVYVQELFPTSVRQTAMGLGSIAIRVAGMLSPLLNLLVMFHWAIPTIVYSSLSLAGGALVVLLPETRGTELPDSIDEVEGKRNVMSKKKGCTQMEDTPECVKSTKL